MVSGSEKDHAVMERDRLKFHEVFVLIFVFALIEIAWIDEIFRRMK